MLFEYRNCANQSNTLYASALEYQVGLPWGRIHPNTGWGVANFVGYLSHGSLPSHAELSRMQILTMNVPQRPRATIGRTEFSAWGLRRDRGSDIYLSDFS